MDVEGYKDQDVQLMDVMCLAVTEEDMSWNVVMVSLSARIEHYAGIILFLK